MVDYSKLSDMQINGMVLCAVTNGRARRIEQASIASGETDFCNNPADAWPIINDNKISIYAMSEKDGRGHWGAEAFYPNESYHFNDNPLRAAMIVFLMMQGETNG